MHQAYLNAPICYLLAYAVEGFGEAPGTLWVGAPGRPKILSFLTRRGYAPPREEKKGIWRACSPPNLPFGRRCVR